MTIRLKAGITLHIGHREGDALAERIGQRIAERRLRLGISAEAFTSVAGLTGEQLTEIEAGQATFGVNQLAVIVQALNMKLIELIG